MEKEEGIAFCTPVLFIQLFDPLPGQPQQRLVLRKGFLPCVPEIRQQTEVQVLVPIRQKPNFQRLDQILDVLRAREHRRDHGQGAQFRRNSSDKVHSRQQMRRRQ